MNEELSAGTMPPPTDEELSAILGGSDGEESDGEESDGEESDGEESDGEESDGEGADARPHPVARRFEINDAGGANWYLKKLRDLQNEKETIQAQTVAMLKAVDAEIGQLEFRFGQQFQAYVSAELARRGGRGKTLPLHQGTASFRTVSASLRVLDAREALEFAQRQGWHVVKRVESLDVEAYKKEAAAVRQETGEVIPGIEIVEARESFTIKFGKRKDAKVEGDPEE